MTRTIAHGGLRATPRRRPLSAGPLRDGPDVSWLSRVVVGEDQGQDGACVVFTLLGWSRVMTPELKDSDCLSAFPRTNAGALRLYRMACADLGRGDEGLYFAEGYHYASAAGWLPAATGVVPVDDLSTMAEAPLLCGYRVTAAWDTVSEAGCLDHSAPTSPDRGLHAVLAAAHGHVDHDDGETRRVVVSNHWTEAWGWMGLGMMSEALHRTLAAEIWRVV